MESARTLLSSLSIGSDQATPEPTEQTGQAGNNETGNMSGKTVKLKKEQQAPDSSSPVNTAGSPQKQNHLKDMQSIQQLPVSSPQLSHCESRKSPCDEDLLNYFREISGITDFSNVNVFPTRQEVESLLAKHKNNPSFYYGLKVIGPEGGEFWLEPRFAKLEIAAGALKELVLIFMARRPVDPENNIESLSSLPIISLGPDMYEVKATIYNAHSFEFSSNPTYGLNKVSSEGTLSKGKEHKALDTVNIDGTSYIKIPIEHL